MSTTTIKKSVRGRRVAKVQRPLKPAKASFADWAKKNAGIVSTGIRDLSTREGFDD